MKSKSFESFVVQCVIFATVVALANVSCVFSSSFEYVPDNARFLGFDEVPLFPGKINFKSSFLKLTNKL